jgi:hypothetical protein
VTHVIIDSRDQLDTAFFARKGITHLHVRMIKLDEVPAELAALGDLEWLKFDNCTLKSFHPRAFEAGSKTRKVEVEIAECTYDGDALFARAMADGLGTWRVKDSSESFHRNPRWKHLGSIDDDGLGDEPFRRAAYELASTGTIADATPGELHLRLLDHSKKPLREKVALYLDQKLPNPLATGAITTGARVLVLGAPIHHDKDALKGRLEALGLATAKSLKDATAVLLLPKPGAKLADALAAKLPILVEGHLEATAKKDAPAPVAATAKEGEGLDRLLFNQDPKNVLLGLSLAKARALEGKLLADVVAVAFFFDDAAVRKEGKALLLASAPEALRGRLQGDKRTYATLDDGGKLTKLVKELAGFGVDGDDFAIATLRVFAGRPHTYAGTFEGALAAALAQPGLEARAFDVLADEPQIFLPMKKTFPPGLSRLKALTDLHVVHGKLKSYANLAELAQIPQPFNLRYWSEEPRLEHLRSIARNVKGLDLHRYRNLTDISALAAFENLVTLNLQETGVSDLTPLLEVLTLRVLDIKGTCFDGAQLAALQAKLPDLRVIH